VILELVPELPGRDEDCIEDLWIAHLGITEYFTDEVDRPLYFVDLTQCITFDDKNHADHADGDCDVEKQGFSIIWDCEHMWFGQEFL